MKICAIICEFNPLHNGHVRLLAEARKLADTVCCIFSGNFVQRGMPAVANKYDRAENAIKAGADVVLELPCVFATSSAENFAYGAMSLLKAIQAETLLFGSISGNIDLIKECAHSLLYDRKANERIKSNMLSGMSYPKAVSESLPKFSKVLSNANDTLGLEYVKAGMTLSVDVEYKTIRRENQNYYDEATDTHYASSAFIRSCSQGDASKYMPFYAANGIVQGIEENYKEYARIFLSTADKEYLSQIEGVTEGLENRIVSADSLADFDGFLQEVKSKRYTLMKLQRIALHAILGITKTTTQNAKLCEPYYKVLAISKNRTDVLSYLSNKACDYRDAKDSSQKCILHIEEKADKLYSTLSRQIIPRNMRIV